MLSYRTACYCTVQYLIVPYDILSYRTGSCPTVLNLVVPYWIIFRTECYCTVQYLMVPYSILLYCTESHRTILYWIIPYSGPYRYSTVLQQSPTFSMQPTRYMSDNIFIDFKVSQDWEKHLDMRYPWHSHFFTAKQEEKFRNDVSQLLKKLLFHHVSSSSEKLSNLQAMPP